MMTRHGTRTAQTLDALGAGETVMATFGEIRLRHSPSAEESAADHVGPDLRYSAGRQYEAQLRRRRTTMMLARRALTGSRGRRGRSSYSHATTSDQTTHNAGKTR